jgi:hypothetical protein
MTKIQKKENPLANFTIGCGIYSKVSIFMSDTTLFQYRAKTGKR